MTTATTVFKTPFNAVAYDYADASLEGCGATAVIHTTPNFVNKTGDTEFYGSANSTACADYYGADESELYGGIGLNGSDWTQATTASATVTLQYNFSWTSSLVAKPSTGRVASASITIYISTVVTCLCNGSTVSSAFGSVLSLYEGSGSKTSDKSGFLFKVVTNKVKLTAGDIYYVTSIVEFELDTSVSASGTGNAHTTLDFEPSSGKSRLVSIAVS